MKICELQYQYEGVILKGYLAVKDDGILHKPVVLVSHDWSGRNEFACKKAEKLAELGYVGFALDMYGDAKVGQTMDEKRALMNPLMENRSLLQGRIQAAFDAVKVLSYVDSNKIAAIGFCFGGLCVLDLARTCKELWAAVSFHGSLTRPTNLPIEPIHSKILVLHGYEDPMVPLTEVAEFASEMKDAHADWQVHMYGQTMHAFTNPMAQDPSFGTVYNAKADARSWQAMLNFLDEAF